MRKKFSLICLGAIVLKCIEYVYYCYDNTTLHGYIRVRVDERLDAPILPFVKLFNDNSRRVRDVNCLKLFRGDKNETAKAFALMDKESFTQRDQIFAKEYINKTKDCKTFKNNRSYILSHLTKEEREFPIAYSIVMYTDVFQFERLLRAIYRPQNLYCIHVDVKTANDILRAVQKIAQCFDNVFLASKRFDVRWGTETVLSADLSCMQELWNKSTTWKYFINLTGQEFPLRTNYELVKILKAYNGSNDVEGGFRGIRDYRFRWKNIGPPPQGIIPTKGNLHVAVCRAYVDFALHDPRAKALLNWVNRAVIPDELFFATLNHNPSLNISGSYKGVTISTDYTKHYVARYVKWYNKLCKGLLVHGVCVFGVGELQGLFSRKELFANKFYWNFEHFALDCMEELLFNKTRDEYLGILDFDASWYSKLEFVTNKIN